MFILIFKNGCCFERPKLNEKDATNGKIEPSCLALLAAEPPLLFAVVFELTRAGFEAIVEAHCTTRPQWIAACVASVTSMYGTFSRPRNYVYFIEL